jgi:hypothetical protein
MAASIKFKVGEIPVEVTDADLAVELLLKLSRPQRAESQAVLPLIVPKSSRGPYKISSDPQNLKLALGFLDAIVDGGQRGAESEAAAAALGVKEKGIGSRLTWVRTLLKELGFDHEAVFYRTKIPGVGRFWKARGQLPAAHERVREMLALFS